MLKRFSTVLLILFALYACSPSSSQIGTPTARSGGELGPTANPPPTAIASPTPESVVQIGEVYLVPKETPPPSDYLDVFHLKVDAGVWTVEEGLINLLGLAAGEGDADALLGGDVPYHGDMSGVMALAVNSLDTGPDTAAKTEIRRLLDVLIPTVERILPYAQPQPEAGSLNAGQDILAAASLPRPDLQSDLCTDLALRGYPTGSDEACIQYTEADLVGGKARVFYPISWWPADPKLVFAATATNALVHSVQVFSQFGPTGSIDLIFGLIGATGPKKVFAVAPFHEGDTCQIVVYPAAVEEAQKRPNGSDFFRQIVAHETFHCFQHWNAPAMTSAGYDANRWWIEGAAEYFSNVAYPNTNVEWEFIPQFDTFSLWKSIVELDYENTVFFQYLQNVDGDAAIVAFLLSISPSSDPQTSLSALAAYPNIETVFHEFAQAWADKQIIDSGGDFLPNKLEIGDPVEIGETSTLNTTTTKPFMIGRYFWRFAPDFQYDLEASASGASGSDSARPAGSPTLWDTPPSTVRGGCGTTPYVLITTSTEVGEEAHKEAYDVTAQDDPECDKCLIGAWQLDAERFQSEFNATLDVDPDIHYEPTVLSGSLTLRFTPGGIFQGFFQDLTFGTRILTPDAFGNLFGLEELTRLAGQAYGTYETDGHNLSVFTPISTVRRQMALGTNIGEPKDQPFIGFGTGSNVPYTCSPEELAFTTIDGATGQPFLFHYLRPPK